MKRTCASTTVLALAVAFLALLSPGTAAAADRDCPDFATQRAAQIYFLHHGGPQRDPDRLDADHDGSACDSNPCPCYHGRHLPGGGAATHPRPHRRTVHSRVALRVAPRARIAGESRAFTITVRPHRARAVVVQRLLGGRWRTVARAHTSRAGRVGFRRPAPSATTSYRAVAPRVVTRSTVFTSARSHSLRATRQVQHVTLALAARVTVGGAVTARVTATPVRRGRPMLLQRRVAGRWVTVAAGRQSRTGTMSHRWTTRAVGRVTYRALARARGGAHAAASAAHVQRVVPPAPTGVSVAPGDGRLGVRWKISPVSGVTGYVVHVVPGDVDVVVPGRLASFAAVTGLSNGTAYTVTVRATDVAGDSSADSAAVAAAPIAPPPVDDPPASPTHVAAVAADAAVTLSWDPGVDTDLASYRVYDVSGSAPALLTTVPAGTTTATVSDLTNGATYAFAVTAMDLAGQESEPSDSVTVTPTAP